MKFWVVKTKLFFILSNSYMKQTKHACILSSLESVQFGTNMILSGSTDFFCFYMCLFLQLSML